MLLGDLIARFTDEAVAAETFLGLSNLALLAYVRAQAQSSGLDLGAYAAAAAQRYASEASEEEWITLIGAMSRAPDPGAVYLERALMHTGSVAP
jgi:hypothetical protein